MKKQNLPLLLFLVFGCTKKSSDAGDILFQKGKYESAINSYTQFLTNNPKHTKTLYNRGRAHEELGNLEEATKDFERVASIDPKHINAYLSLAKLSYNSKNYNKVLVYSKEALKIDENNAHANFLTARGTHQQGFLNQALAYYDNAIAINKDFGEAYLYRGALKLSLKKERAACEDFTIATRLDQLGAEEALTNYCEQLENKPGY